MKTITVSDLIESVMNNTISELHTCIPGVVLEYNPAKQKATVQPLIKRRYKDAGNDSRGLEDMPVVVGVPVMFPAISNGILAFPIKRNDLVLLLFSERSIDNLMFSDGSKTIDPADERKHNFSDAIAIPGFFTFNKVIGTDPDDVVLRFNVNSGNENEVRLKANGDVILKTAGDAITTLKQGGDIEVTTPTNFKVTAGGNVELNASGQVKIQASGVVDIDGSQVTLN